MLRNYHPVNLVVTSQLPNLSKDSKPTVIMNVVGQRHPSRRISSPPRTVPPLWRLLLPAWVIQARYYVKHWCLLLDLACFFERTVMLATFETQATLVILYFSWPESIPDPPALPDRDNTNSDSAKPEDYVGNCL